MLYTGAQGALPDIDISQLRYGISKDEVGHDVEDEPIYFDQTFIPKAENSVALKYENTDEKFEHDEL
ncbi:hypothetical protein EB796_006733 [Bugula neritina]|uniref:Uncharacterized protein n=1 Tax=Bugula neritina TaxID=10212 RepID=A0A7J7K8K2_BUGNE|nr:hypothetical protein EB796_006733 [Bugula neritina]